MKKPISPRGHGVVDYATVGLTLLAPRLLGFPRSAARAAYSLASGYGALSAFTDYPLGIRRVVPFRAHGAAEAVVGLALPALPRMLGFGRHRAARNFFLGLTALTAVVGALTDWQAGGPGITGRGRRAFGADAARRRQDRFEGEGGGRWSRVTGKVGRAVKGARSPQPALS